MPGALEFAWSVRAYMNVNFLLNHAEPIVRHPRRWGSYLFFVCLLQAVVWSSGCWSCAPVACGGSIDFKLTTMSGDVAIARGEVRTGSVVHSFDCSSMSSSATPLPLGCVDGKFNMPDDYHPPRTKEIRFETGAGAWTDWIEVPITYHDETLEDFGGQGCNCTLHNGTAEVISVPTEAQLPSTPNPRDVDAGAE